jgi:phosphate-selective porin OprO/OprP
MCSRRRNSRPRSTPGRPNNTAWQVEASYFLTGEENSFKATSLKHVIPWHRFAPGDGGWGAFEVVARVQQLTLDNNAFQRYGGSSFATAGSAQAATSWGVGVNWYLNANVKLNLDYESTTFSGGTQAAGATSSTPEHVILSRVQFSF